jgi:hypothetical protein
MKGHDILEDLGLRWTEPIPLREAVTGQDAPAARGLYRIRRVGLPAWDYIGQTGDGTMNLRKRMAMLNGVYRAEMPYRDPHTAGPGLWALRRQTDLPFEASFCPVEAPTPWRKGLEAVAIAAHCQQHGHSPTLNFGRMPAGYRMSSANNARLVAADKRFRGGPAATLDASHSHGVPPRGALDPAITSLTWCGHAWTAWIAMTTDAIATAPLGNGLYRIAGTDDRLVYVGEGAVRARLITHLAKLNGATSQGTVFAAHAPLTASIVIDKGWDVTNGSNWKQT